MEVEAICLGLWRLVVAYVASCKSSLLVLFSCSALLDTGAGRGGEKKVHQGLCVSAGWLLLLLVVVAVQTGHPMNEAGGEKETWMLERGSSGRGAQGEGLQ